MRLSLGPRLVLAHQCPVCRYNRDEDLVADNLTAIALFGATKDPYSICPACLREIHPPDCDDTAFRQRARVAWFTRWNNVAHYDLTGRQCVRRAHGR